MKKILIVEDEAIVAKDLTNLLSAAGYKICGVAHNYKEGMELFKKIIPDLILCDLNLGSGKTGIDLVIDTKKIKEIPVVFLTAYADMETVSTALETMPASYLTKPFTNEQILITIYRILDNNKKKTKKERVRETPNPTRREFEIIQFVSQGKSSREIAKKLSISFETVQSHRKNILHKYNLSSSVELTAFAHKHRWIT